MIKSQHCLKDCYQILQSLLYARLKEIEKGFWTLKLMKEKAAKCSKITKVSKEVAHAVQTVVNAGKRSTFWDDAKNLITHPLCNSCGKVCLGTQRWERTPLWSQRMDTFIKLHIFFPVANTWQHHFRSLDTTSHTPMQWTHKPRLHAHSTHSDVSRQSI